MSIAKKLPSGKWRNLLYVGKDENGKRKYESFTADTAKEANALAAARARELEIGVKKDRAPAMMTVGEACDAYIEANAVVLAPKTIREYKGYRKNNFQQLMPRKISTLSSSVMQREIGREAQHLSPKSIRNIYGFILTAIRAVVPDARYDVNLPAKIKKEMTIPTDDQLLALLADAEGTRMELPILIGASCGLRRGEIGALDFDKDIDYQKNLIHVRRSMQHDADGNWFPVEYTKTYTSTRTVNCPPWVIEKIKAARDAGYTPVNPAYITAGFRKLADKQGLRDLHFHNLRHYYVSLLISLNAPDQYIMARTGHATASMLHDVYGHLMPDRDKQITGVVNDHFASMQHGMQHDADGGVENTAKTGEKKRNRKDGDQ